MERVVVDLSHIIEPGMPCYPGTPGADFFPISSIEKQGYSEQLLTLSSHSGTHVDMPSHIFQDGLSLDDIRMDRFIGKGMVIDVSGSACGMITVEALDPFSGSISGCEFLLLCSGWSRYWGTPLYYEGYPVLSSDAARWLSGFHLKGLGVDMISVDAPVGKEFPVHSRLLQQGILLIENLAFLAPLLHRSFTFCCFPLKILKGEASPVRAVALFDN